MKLVMSNGMSSPRVPRSKWTVEEMLCLVEAKKESLEDEVTGVEWLMQGAAHRAPFAKWQAVASVCSSKCGAKKSHTQCFLKWRRLLKPWRAIFLTGPSHYWLMSRDERKAAGLPLSFNRKIFNAILHAFNASDNVKGSPQSQEPQARREETKSSTIDIVDVEDLPRVKIEEEEEHELLQMEEETGGWDACGIMPSPPVEENPTVGQHEGNRPKRSPLNSKNYKVQEEKKYEARILHDSSRLEEDNLQSRVAETSQARAHTNLSSQQNHVEENHTEENIDMEDNDMLDCSTNLRLDKETIGKFLESINSMAKVMEAIVRALTR